MSGDLAFLVAPAAAFAVICAAPGPATLAVATTAMAAGRGAALALSAGLSISLAAWGALAAAGLGPLLAAFAPALLAFKIGGALFLLWLAWGSLRSALRDEAPPRAAAGGGRWIVRGMVLNGMNPKALLAWGATIALGLRAESPPAEIWSIWALCAALGASIYVAYALLFAAPPARAAYARARRWIEGAAAVLFGAAALRLLAWRAP